MGMLTLSQPRNMVDIGDATRYTGQTNKEKVKETSMTGPAAPVVVGDGHQELASLDLDTTTTDSISVCISDGWVEVDLTQESSC